MAPQLMVPMHRTCRQLYAMSTLPPRTCLPIRQILPGRRVWLPRVGYHIARVIGAAPVASVVTIVVLVASVFPVTKTLSISIFHNRLGPVLLGLIPRQE
jgi:hypothetical protein